MRKWRHGGAAALAGALVVCGTLLPASAAVAAGHKGFEVFKMWAHTVGATTDTLRATGAVVAEGHAVPSAIVSGHGTVRLELPKGSIKLSLDVLTSAATVPNPTTCDFSETNSGTYKVTSGSGRYAGASGSGNFHTRITASLVMSGGVCTAKLATYRKYQAAWGQLRW